MSQNDILKINKSLKAHKKYIDHLHRRISGINTKTSFSLDDGLIRLTIYTLMVIGVCFSFGLNFAILWLKLLQ